MRRTLIWFLSEVSPLQGFSLQAWVPLLQIQMMRISDGFSFVTSSTFGTFSLVSPSGSSSDSEDDEEDTDLDFLSGVSTTGIFTSGLGFSSSDSEDEEEFFSLAIVSNDSFRDGATFSINGISECTFSVLPQKTLMMKKKLLSLLWV